MTDTTTRPTLIRTLAEVLLAPPDAQLCSLLGLPAPPGADVHTSVFVFETHPYASVHLGAEGMIGGDAGDRVAGFWRALGLVPPAEADHLAGLLGLYASLGVEELTLPVDDRRRKAVRSARAALAWEHLAPFAVVHLATVARLGDEFYCEWAMLARDALVGEAGVLPERAELPTALATAPPPLALDSREALLAAVLAPVRCGMVITRSDLARAGEDLGLAVRRGERRFALDALLDQDPAGILAWLGRLAEEWSSLHRLWHAGALEPVGEWWAARARSSAVALADGASEVRR